jgi:hypothetical protein
MKLMKKRKRTLAELRTGQPTLNNGQPAQWLINIVGQEASHIAVLFDAPSVELLPEGTLIRLQEANR